MLPETVAAVVMIFPQSESNASSSSRKSPLCIAKLCKHAVATITTSDFCKRMRKGMRRQRNLCFQIPSIVSTFPLVLICALLKFFSCVVVGLATGVIK